MKLFRNKRGQNTVEYLLMLTVVVGVVLLVGALLKNKLPTIASSISDMISSAGSSLGKSGGN